MALLKSSNPALQEKSFQGTILEGLGDAQVMSVNGTMNKLGIMMVLMIGTTLFSWNQFYQGGNPMTLMLIGVFGGLVVAIILAFKKEWGNILGPLYAILEGLFVGSISAIYNYTYPGLPMQAVALTLLVTLVMFLIYRYRIIRVTGKFRMVIIIATAALMFFYLIQWLWVLFTGSPLTGFTNAATPMGIGFSVLVSALAALNLLLNFDTIEKGVELRAAKYMEWYCAFGLLVTIVWLYFELLRLLSKIQRN
jgi:uncharacterized YccA/Bax inhibitor family protein